MKKTAFIILTLLSTAALAQNAPVQSKDTIRPDTTQLVPIHVTPLDTPHHHNMPVVNPTTQDSLQMKKEENPKRREE